MAAGWLQRHLDETQGVRIDEATMVVGCLAALDGPLHESLVTALRDTATSIARNAKRAESVVHPC
jgi:hypothetical protein